MGFLLKLFRIFFIFVVPIVIVGAIFKNIYINIDTGAEKYSWISLIAIFIFMYVLYRNKYQFNGWDERKDKEKLSKGISLTLITLSAILLSLPLIFSYLNI